MWDFWSLTPESLHQVTILMSDRGIPKSPMHMHGFSSHTFSFWNNNGERFWFKLHFKTQQEIQNLTNQEAQDITGKTREYYQEQLFGAIEKGDFPRWTVYAQIMPEEDALKTPYNPFDLTKVWPHSDYPLIEIGVMELNENPSNYFQYIENAAFSPSNIVPGISFSPDKVLQARIFSYADAHRYRLGTHYEFLPANHPLSENNPYYKDGQMRFFENLNENPDAYYEPNSKNGPVEDRSFQEPPYKIHGDINRFEENDTYGDFKQPGDLFRLFTEEEKQRLFNNIKDAMQGVSREIIERQLKLFDQADPEYGNGVRKALGI